MPYLVRRSSFVTTCLFAPCVLVVGCAMQAGDEPVGRTSFAATVCATGSTVNGVDVSVYQGTVDWTSVKAAGLDFAIARISDGSDLDSQFATNWTAMKSAGLVRGAYQYWEPGQDPTTQANIVISAVGMLGSGDLPVTADMETTGGQSAATIVANLQTWSAAVQAGTGMKPMIYTAEGFWNGSVDSSSFASNPLWVANWGVTCPDLPDGWSAWDFWQNADNGTVSGISGNVDTDEFNGTLAQLQAFAGGATSGDGGSPPYYAATYVSQSWPLASTTWMLTTCQTVASSITLKNSGTTAWDSNTRLGTTQPRDRTSVFADQTWVSVNRAAQVSGTVAPGDTFELKFDFHAPPTAGTYTEYFGMVEDGVAWFSDPGQGGPPDTDIEANIQVTGATGSCTVDMGAPDGGVPTADAGPKSDAGKAPGDAGKAMGEAGATGPTGGNDGGTPVESPDGNLNEGDGSTSPTPDAETGGKSGCACDVARPDRGLAGPAGAFFALALGLARRKRR